MKNNITRTLGILLLLLSGCGYVGTIAKSEASLSEVAENGQILINALKKYKEVNSDYPEKYDLLFPDYIKSKELLLYDFHYVRMNTDGDYKISFNEIKQWVALGDKSRVIFVYYSSEKYPEQKYRKTLKRVGDWALVEQFRRYGNETNPPIDPEL